MMTTRTNQSSNNVSFPLLLVALLVFLIFGMIGPYSSCEGLMVVPNVSSRPFPRRPSSSQTGRICTLASCPSPTKARRSSTVNSPSLQLYYQSDGSAESESESDDDYEFRTRYYGISSVNNEQKGERIANAVLKSSQSSFKNVERKVDGLLEDNPIVALSIFVGAGCFVAYLTGLFFLGGYIEDLNPASNAKDPYWDDQILIIQPKSKEVGRV